MDDQWRRMIDQINAVNDPVRSIRDSLDSALSQWNKEFAIDALEHQQLIDAFKSPYQDNIARMKELLADLQPVKYTQYQLPSKVLDDLVDQWKIPKISGFGDLGIASLRDTYARLAESIDSQFKGIKSQIDDQLSPLLSAQAQWARIAQVPSSMEQMRLFSVGANALVEQLLDVRSSLDSLPPFDFEEEIDDEEAEQAIAVANERLAKVFTEKAPAGTIKKYKSFWRLLSQGRFGLPLRQWRY